MEPDRRNVWGRHSALLARRPSKPPAIPSTLRAGIPNVGPNSHFFTASQDECAVVRDKVDWHWYLEGAPFWANEPQQGTSPA